MEKKQLLLIAAVCGGVLFLGSLLAWVKAPSVEFMGQTVGGGSISGTQFTVGVFVLILGLVGGAAALAMALGKTDIVKLAPKQYALIAAGALGLAALLSIIKFFEIGPKGIGIWLCFLAGIGGAACMFLVLRQMGVIPESAGGGEAKADDDVGGNDGGE